MSNEQRIFLRRLTIVLISICGPTVILIAWGLIGMYFGEKQMKEMVETNTKNVEYIRKYYMTTQDFWNYFDAQKQLYDAKIEGNTKDIDRLERELADFRNQFDMKTRGINLD